MATDHRANLHQAVKGQIEGAGHVIRALDGLVLDAMKGFERILADPELLAELKAAYVEEMGADDDQADEAMSSIVGTLAYKLGFENPHR